MFDIDSGYTGRMKYQHVTLLLRNRFCSRVFRCVIFLLLYSSASWTQKDHVSILFQQRFSIRQHEALQRP